MSTCRACRRRSLDAEEVPRGVRPEQYGRLVQAVPPQEEVRALRRAVRAARRARARSALHAALQLLPAAAGARRLPGVRARPAAARRRRLLRARARANGRLPAAANAVARRAAARGREQSTALPAAAVDGRCAADRDRLARVQLAQRSGRLLGPRALPRREARRARPRRRRVR